MMARLLLWRVMALIGGKWRGLRVGEQEGKGGWQDKTGAVGVDGVARLSGLFSASHAKFRLAAITENDAVQPFPEPLQGIS